MSLRLGDNLIASNMVTGDTLPIGVIISYPNDTIPSNWLLCNGQAISRTLYSELFAILGTSHGAGDGSTTFNVPNINKRTIVGKDNTDTDFNAIGKTLGEKTHILTTAELPSTGVNTKYASTAGGDGSGLVYGTSIGNSNDGLVKLNGTNTPHNNMQPSIVENYIIKAKQSAGVVATVEDVLTSTNTTNALSAKQGKLLNDMISKRYLVTSYVNGSSGYNLYSDGYVEQWGVTTTTNVNGNSGVDLTVTLPKTMANTNYLVQVNMATAGSYWSFVVFRASASSATQIIVNTWNNSANQAVGMSFAWRVTGYATV